MFLITIRIKAKFYSIYTRYTPMVHGRVHIVFLTLLLLAFSFQFVLLRALISVQSRTNTIKPTHTHTYSHHTGAHTANSGSRIIQFRIRAATKCKRLKHSGVVCMLLNAIQCVVYCLQCIQCVYWAALVYTYKRMLFFFLSIYFEYSAAL